MLPEGDIHRIGSPLRICHLPPMEETENSVTRGGHGEIWLPVPGLIELATKVSISLWGSTIATIGSVAWTAVS